MIANTLFFNLFRWISQVLSRSLFCYIILFSCIYIVCLSLICLNICCLIYLNICSLICLNICCLIWSLSLIDCWIWAVRWILDNYCIYSSAITNLRFYNNFLLFYFCLISSIIFRNIISIINNLRTLIRKLCLIE